MPRLLSALKRLFQGSFDWAWVLMFLLLPITTLPMLSARLGGVAVAPASILPLVWLVLWFALFLWKRESLPFEGIPFLVFVSLAAFSSLLAFYSLHPTFKAWDLLGTGLESFLTLGIGAAFYFVTMAWLSSRPHQFARSLRFLDYAGLVMLTWSLLQAVFIFFFNSAYPSFMTSLQELFNTRGLFYGRITGFAFEPSWLAHQVNLLFLPFWIAASVKRSSVHRFRLGRLILEDFLLILGVLVVFLSSRVGTLAVLLVIVYLAVRLHLHLFRKLAAALGRRLASRPPFLRFIARVFALALLVSLLVLLYLLILVALLFVLSRVDPRLARLFDLDTLRANLVDPYQLFNQLSFAERFVYWVAGWRIFNDFPLFGVGLGNAGLYFQSYLPSYSWVLPEVLESIYRIPSVMNIKSFGIRLLAETGVAGFAAFLAWCTLLWRTSRFLEANASGLLKAIGLAGQLTLLAFVLESFSIDSFALPYLWISLGIVSAAGMAVRKLMADSKP